MFWKMVTFLLVFLPLVLTSMAQPAAASSGALEDFEKRSTKFGSVVRLPRFEVTTNEVHASVQQTISAGNAALDKLAALDLRKVNFKNTVGELDAIGYQISLTDNRLQVIKETSTDAGIR